MVDPELDAPIRVQFTLAVYDFGRGQAKAEAAAPAGDEAKEKAASGKEAK